MSTAPTPSASGPVLLYDGECGLCNRVVRWLLRIDRRGVLRFAPLQGPAAQAFLRAQGLPADDFDSLVFIPDWSRRGEAKAGRAVHGTGGATPYLLRTDGVIAALRAIGATTRAVLLAPWPRAWRDAGYRLVASWRYRIFGQWQACPLPRPEWRARFIE